MNSSAVGDVDLNLLVAFDALMVEGSVSRAAKRLGLSQPAFSNALGRLRRAVGDPLFRPTGHGMAPTPRAVAMAVPVRAALEGLQRALSPADRNASQRVITLAANQYARCLVLPIVAKVLARLAPGVSLHVRELSDANAVVAPPVDFSLAWSPFGRHDSDSSVLILRDELVGVARRTSRRVTMDVFERGRRIIVRELADSAGTADPDSHEVSDALSAMCVASHMDAIAVVPRRLAKRFSSALGLTIVRLPYRPPGLILSLASTGAVSHSSDPAAAIVKHSLIQAGEQLGKRS